MKRWRPGEWGALGRAVAEGPALLLLAEAGFEVRPWMGIASGVLLSLVGLALIVGVFVLLGRRRSRGPGAAALDLLVRSDGPSKESDTEGTEDRVGSGEAR